MASSPLASIFNLLASTIFLVSRVACSQKQRKCMKPSTKAHHCCLLQYYTSHRKTPSILPRRSLKAHSLHILNKESIISICFIYQSVTVQLEIIWVKYLPCLQLPLPPPRLHHPHHLFHNHQLSHSCSCCPIHQRKPRTTESVKHSRDPEGLSS